MNKCTFLFWALLCLLGTWSSTYGQTELSFEEEVALVTAPLDVGDLQTGFLIDRSVGYRALNLFDGRTDIDSFNFTARDLQWAYVMLDIAHTDTLPLVPNGNEYWERMESYKDAPFVLLSALLFQFDTIRGDAVDENLLYVSDDQLFDVLSRTESPYNVDTTWIGAIGRKTWWGDSVLFRTSPSLWLSNMNLSESNLLIDYDNGSGWEQAAFLLDTTVTYSSLGEKVIRFGYVLNPGDTLIAHSSLLLKGAILPTPPGGGGDRSPTYNIQRDDVFYIGDTYQKPVDWQWYYDEELDMWWQEAIAWETAPLNGVEVSIFYNKNCGDPEIRKPLIIVEGFDPANTNDERLLFDGEFNSENTQVGPSLLGQVYGDPNFITLQDHLHDTDYDVFYINYLESDIDAKVNAAYVIEAIKEINRLKAEAGSQEKNVVIGASLGGVVGKIALRQMEDAEEDHETELYISFDAPLKGANVPLALQAMVVQLANYSVLGETLYEKDSNIKAQYDALFSPVAQQLLYYHMTHIDSILYHPDNKLSTSHDEFYDWFENLGDLTTCEQIAISNGAIEGSGMQFSPGDELFNIQVVDLAGDDQPAKVSIQFTGHALPTYQQTAHEFYRGTIMTTVGWLVIKKHEVVFTINKVQPYDSAPGGMRTFYEVESGIKTPLVGDSNYRSFCFIPTISSLDLDETDPYYPLIDLTEVNDVINNGFTSLAAYTGPTEVSSHYDGDVMSVNQPHVSLDRRHVRHLLSRIGSLAKPLSLVNNKTFNFGVGEMSEFDPLEAGIRATDNTIRNDLEITGTGEVWINKLNRIGYIDEIENPETDINTEYIVNVIKNPCTQDPTIISISNGGEMTLGESLSGGSFNKGSLILNEDTKLIVEDGGKVLLNIYSKIVIKDKAVLEVQEGGLLEPIWGSKIEIEDGGELIIRDGGTLQLVSFYAKVVINEGGKMTIEDNANIHLWDGSTMDGTVNIQVRGEMEVMGDFNLSGNGYFDFFNTHTLKLTGGKLNLEGYDKECRLIRLNDGTKLEIGSNDLNIKNARIDYHTNTWVEAENGSTVFMENVHLKSEGTLNSGLIMENYRRLSLDKVDVTDFDHTGVSVSTNDGTFPIIHTYVTGCTFSNNTSGLGIENVKQAFVINSNFEGTNETGEGLLFSRVEQMGVSNCNFNDLQIAIYVLEGRNRLGLSKSRIEDCHYGIRSDIEDTEFNLIATQGTVFENNKKAILISEGGFGTAGDYGLVLFDCVKLINNDMGIEGRDLLLQIDAFTNSHSVTNFRSNTFKCNSGQLLFRLCFDVRNISTSNPIPARGNFWDFSLPFTNEPWYTQRAFCASSSASGMIDYSNYVSTEPVGCPVGDDQVDIGHNQMLCSIQTGPSTTIDVRSVYKNFYKSWTEDLDNEYYDSEGDWYDILSDVNYIDASSTTVNSSCKHQLDVMNTFRKGTLLLRRASDEKTVSTAFTTYPNPVTNNLYCELPEGEWDIRITDISGREVLFFKHQEGTVELDCNSLMSGVYFIHAITETESKDSRTEMIKFVKL